MTKKSFNGREGCEYGRTNRIMIKQVCEDINDIKSSVVNIENKNEQMFNHFTETYQKMFDKFKDKVPQWIIAISGIAGALIGGLAIWALTH